MLGQRTANHRNRVRLVVTAVSVVLVFLVSLLTEESSFRTRKPLWWVQKLIHLDGPGQSIATSPDGSRVAVLHNFGRGFEVFTSDGHRTRSGSGGGLTVSLDAIAFSNNDYVMVPSGEVWTSDNMLEVWPAVPRDNPRIIEGPMKGGGSISNHADRIAVSADCHTAVVDLDLADGDRVAVVALSDWRVKLFDLRPFLGKLDVIRSVSISPNGDLLGIGTIGGQLLLISSEDGHLVDRYQVYDKLDIEVASVGFSYDAKYLATGGSRPAESVLASSPRSSPQTNGVKIWDIKTHTLVRSISTDFKSVSQLSFSPTDSRIIAYSVEREAVYLDSSNGVKAEIASSPDGVAFVFANNKRQLFVASGYIIKRIEYNL